MVQNVVINPAFRNDYSVAEDGVLQFSKAVQEASIFNNNYANFLGSFSSKGVNVIKAGSANGISRAFNVTEDGRIPTYKSTSVSGNVWAEQVAVIETASLLENYLGGNTFTLNRPDALVNGVLRKTAEMGIFGFDENVENITVAHSAFAKSTKVTSFAELLANIASIRRQGYTPVLAGNGTKDDAVLTLATGAQDSQNTLLFNQLSATLQALPFFSIPTADGYVLYAKELLNVAGEGQVLLTPSDSAVISTLDNSGKDGFGTDWTNTPTMNAYTQAKRAIRALYIEGYNYIGDETTAFALPGTQLVASTDTGAGSVSDLYESTLTPSTPETPEEA
jgi:hypothetical protein